MGSMGSGESIALGRYVLLRRLRMQGAVEVHLGLQRSVAGVETLVVIKRETNGWRWAAFTFLYMTALAYAGAWATYRLGMLVS